MNSSNQSSPQSQDADRRHFQAIIFDLDGTLLHTLPDLVVLTNSVLTEGGFPERSEEEILSFVGNGVPALIDQAIPEDAEDDEVENALERWKYLYPRYGHRLTQPFEGMPEVIDALKASEVKIGVLSNKYDCGVRDVIGAFYPDTFEVAYGECEKIPRKPDPTGLLRVLDELGVSPENALYVGDSPGDIAVSRNAGVAAAVVAWGYHEVELLQEAAPDFVLEHPRELLSFIASRPQG